MHMRVPVCVHMCVHNCLRWCGCLSVSVSLCLYASESTAKSHGDGIEKQEIKIKNSRRVRVTEECEEYLEPAQARLQMIDISMITLFI
jgi:hypothetical protein